MSDLFLHIEDLGTVLLLVLGSSTAVILLVGSLFSTRRGPR